VYAHRGFSLVELMAGLAVAVVLAALAAPAFRGTLADSRRTAAVNALVRAVHGARVAAMTRGVDVAVCPSRDGRQCSGGPDWAGGFLAFANRDRDQPPRVDAGEPVLLVGGAYAGGSIRANRASFVLRPPGRRSVNGTFVVCDARGLPAARVVVVSPSGRPRTAPAAEAPSPVSCPG
jgi:type IV fimbrial biogenesis protein FimT